MVKFHLQGRKHLTLGDSSDVGAGLADESAVSLSKANTTITLPVLPSAFNPNTILLHDNPLKSHDPQDKTLGLSLKDAR